MHELSGAFEKHPERKAARAREPKPKGPLGPPPASFDPETYTGAKLMAIWYELVSQVPPGVATSADRWHVELACRLMHRIRNSSAKAGDYSRLDVLLGKMGMNPADRSKVNIAPGARSAASGDDSKSGKGNEFGAIAKEGSRLRPN
jgi:hypothetical protein